MTVTNDNTPHSDEHHLDGTSAQANPLEFNFGKPPPTFTDKEEERRFLKERLALAYRVFAKLGLCQSQPLSSAPHLPSQWLTLATQTREPLATSQSVTLSVPTAFG